MRLRLRSLLPLLRVVRALYSEQSLFRRVRLGTRAHPLLALLFAAQIAISGAQVARCCGRGRRDGKERRSEWRGKALLLLLFLAPGACTALALSDSVVVVVVIATRLLDEVCVRREDGRARRRRRCGARG